ncbi:MAG TPA: GDSL-type esterase/lipase family protein, partial [Lachnospiraceae bacterium]|nr:GDSL-type esterase/lipase family protein [Lachnospiraceae bacterium]
MKNLRDMKKYPFLVTIVLSALLLSILGVLGKSNVYEDYSVNLLKMPLLTVVLEGVKQGEYPWSATNNQIFEENDMELSCMAEVIPTFSNIVVAAKNGKDKGSSITEVSEVKDSMGRQDQRGDALPQKDSKEETYSFQKVDKDYFKDALFIGDSRTVGLSEYSGLDEPTYYADVGLSIYKVFDKKIAKVNGKKVTIETALKKKSFGKIYIMLGINEIGTGTAESFTKEYKRVIERIHELQPNAIIYVEAIMKVGKGKSDKDPIFNNKNIQDRNNHLAKLADGKTYFYIDVNEVLTNKSGN